MSRFSAVAPFVAVVLLAGCSGSSNEQALPPAKGSTTSRSAAAGFAAIPRTRISLPVPEGMQVDGTLPGLSKPGSRTGVIVVEQELVGKTEQQGLAELRESFSGARAKAQGFEMGAPQETTVAGFQAVVFTGSQRISDSVVFEKAVVGMMAEGKLVIMTGTIQREDPMSAAEMRSVLTKARWNKEIAPGGFGFDITPAPGYQRTESSGGLVYSLGPRTDTTVPKLIAAPSLGLAVVAQDERRDFAIKRFGSLNNAPTPDTTTEVSIDGLPGFELVGKGKNNRTHYMVALFTEGGYVLIIGDFDSAVHPDQLPAFQAMAKSFVQQ
ncbi:hypothetical protein JOF56_007751 [Kibdelosporangium banguiense]|uniref:DUF1795 domain-containing protein n=1 Tax=Kibdelosporangium banguiense TaxID=1365924 RepID=A0ABS4TSI0_9PSEU|nr:hypothetical protein [Kibdelosporangium banguiense]MBP2327366.1 hypothetical protein [Kibdelosporangium banguiense]